MVSKEQAIKIASKELTQLYNMEIVIHEPSIIEKEDAWIMNYNTKKWFETNDFNYVLLGAGPIAIRKSDGALGYYDRGKWVSREDIGKDTATRD